MGIVSKITTLTSREFNQDLARAKRAAEEGPVVVTDRGRPAHVLLSFEEYQRLKDEVVTPGKKMSELLAMRGGEELELNIPRIDEFARAAELD